MHNEHIQSAVGLKTFLYFHVISRWILMKLYDVRVAGIRNQHQRLMKCLLGIVLYSERFMCIFISVEQMLFTDKKTEGQGGGRGISSKFLSILHLSVPIYSSVSPTPPHKSISSQLLKDITLEILFFSPPSAFFPSTGLFFWVYKHTESLFLVKQKHRSKTIKIPF